MPGGFFIYKRKKLTKKAQLYQLDSLRGIAAIFIVILHFSAYLTPLISQKVLTCTPALFRSYLFVDMFFILSGFVMAYTYSDKFNQKISFSEYKNFILKRFIRIYPLHIIIFLILVFFHRYFLLQFNLPEDSFVLNRNNFHILSNILLLQSSGLGWGDCINCSSWNYPSWSISVEWICYFLIPLIIYKVRSLKIIGLLGILASYFAFYYFLEKDFGSIDVQNVPGIVRCILGMSLGVWIYKFAYKKFNTSNTTMLSSMVVLILSMHFLLVDVAVVGIIAIILAFAINLPSKNFLNNKPLKWLGDRSYSIYMLHVLVQDIFNFLVRFLLKKSSWDLGLFDQLLLLCVSTIAVIILSHFSYIYLEKRITKSLRSIILKK